MNGSKTFITNGVRADFVVTAVKTTEDGGHQGLSFLILERGMKGFEVGDLVVYGSHGVGRVAASDGRATEQAMLVLDDYERHEDGRSTWGRSTVVAPWGEVVAKLDHDAPGVLFATLDFDAVDKARNAVPQLTHDREFTPPS